MSVEDIVRKCFWKFGLDVKRASLPGSSLGLTLNLIDFMAADVVVDVGANEGQFALSLLSYRPETKIVSFEPGANAYQTLLRRSNRYRAWEVAERIALGDREGISTLFVTKDSQSSSLRPAAKIGPKLGSAFESNGTELVPVKRLDSVRMTAIDGAKNIYLKIDVQGFENEVFNGCQMLLPRVGAIQVEVSLDEIYQGQEFGLKSLDPFLKAGYAIYGISNGWRDSISGKLIQFDAFMVRTR